MARRRVAVLISGRGSNLHALLKAAADPFYPAEIALVLSNRAEAQGLLRAQEHRVPTLVINHKDFATRDDFDSALTKALRRAEIDLICLAGFMRVLSAGFIADWPDRILNIHPSLLPAFRGLNVQTQALAAGVKLSGCTVHIVRPALDDGPIIAQAAVPVLPDDDVEKLTARILAAEHQLYPAALALIASKTAVVRGDKVEIAADFQGLSAKALFSFTL